MPPALATPRQVLELLFPPSAVDDVDVAVAETCSLTAGVRRGVVLTYRVLSRRGRYVEIRRRNKSGSGKSGKRG